MIVKDKLSRYFFGYDVFISYSRSDAFDYAGNLAIQLNKDGFSTFVDQAGTPQGKDVPAEVLRHARLAGVMIVIGSPAALASPSVKQEVDVFCDTGNPLLPVIFWNEKSDIKPAELISSADWGHNLTGLPISIEKSESLSIGLPSKEVIQRVALAVGSRRQFQRIQRSIKIATAVLGLLLLAWIVAGRQLVISLNKLTQSDIKLKQQQHDINMRELSIKNLRTEFKAVQGTLSSAKKDAIKYSLLAKKEAIRVKEQEKVSAKLWDTLEPQLQYVYKQPTIECIDGKVKLEVPISIYVSPVRPLSQSWNEDVLKMLQNFVRAYNSCYQSSNNKPRVTVEGHSGVRTSEDLTPYDFYPQASSEFSLALSERSARAVTNFLVELGLASENINLIYYGNEHPLYASSSNIGSFLNSRVEINIQDKELKKP